MSQAVAIDRCIAHRLPRPAVACRPDLLLLDDPTAGLDPLVRGEVLAGVLESVAEKGGAVVYASHLIHDVERVADNVAFLDQMVTMFAACAIVCYTMYTVDPTTVAKFEAGKRMVWTVPFVVFGIARYAFLVQTGLGGSSPTKIFLGGDRLFLLNTLGWLAVLASVLVS